MDKEEAEDKLISGAIVAKDQARNRFKKITSITEDSIKKVSSKADEIAVSAKSKVQDAVRVNYGKTEKGETTEIKTSEASDSKGGESGNMMAVFAKELAFFSAVCLSVYLVGYLQWSFLFVFLALVTLTVGNARKVARRQKAEFHRRVADLGEEAALKSVMHGELPSWVSFPDKERAEWLNAILVSVWPFLGEFVDSVLKKDVEPQVREVLDAKGLGGFRFRQIHFGKIAPKVVAIKVYDTPRPDEIMMDLDVEYFGDLDVGISLMKVSASVADVQFEAKVRVIMKPLVGLIPIVGGVQVYFLQEPHLDFDLGGAASILDMPGLNGLLKDAIQQQIAAQLILPNKVSVILSDDVSAEELKMPHPVGVLLVKVVEAKSLMQTDSAFCKIDPYAIVSLGAAEQQTSVASGTSPTWSDESMEFPVEVPDSEELQLLLKDQDRLDEDDFLGSARLDIDLAARGCSSIDTWVSLEGVESGQVRLKLYWMPVSNRESDFRASADAKHSRAVLCLYVDSARLLPGTSDDVPSAVAELSVGDVRRETRAVASHNPTFREGFTMLLGGAIAKDTLKVKVRDIESGHVFGSVKVPLSRILEEDREELKLPLEEHDLTSKKNEDNGGGVVKFSAKISYLAPCKDSGRESAYSLQKASQLAGSSKRLVGSALGNAAKGMMSVGSGVSSVGSGIRKFSRSPRMAFKRDHDKTAREGKVVPDNLYQRQRHKITVSSDTLETSNSELVGDGSNMTRSHTMPPARPDKDAKPNNDHNGDEEVNGDGKNGGGLSRKFSFDFKGFGKKF